jgi:hypothetical protein
MPAISRYGRMCTDVGHSDPSISCADEATCRVAWWKEGDPEAEHVAPSASLQHCTRADRRRCQGGSRVVEALTPLPIGAIRD